MTRGSSARLDSEGRYLPNGKQFKSNPLLVKTEIGRTRRSTFDLPPSQHAFGKVNRADLEGAKEVTLTWQDHRPGFHPRAAKDFVSMNRRAAMRGASNAKDVKSFRKTTDIRQRTGPFRQNGTAVPLTQVQVDDHRERIRLRKLSFGKGSRPSTPISHLISNDFQAEWLVEQKRHLARQSARGAKSPRVRDIKPTKATLGHSRQKNFASLRLSQNSTYDPKFNPCPFKNH